MLARLLTALLAASLATASPAAAVYRWTDHAGVVHYDDVNTGAQKMTQDILDKRHITVLPDWVGAIPGDFAAEVDLNCRTWRDRLSNYRSASQLFGRTPDGDVYPMSPTQVKLMIGDTEREAQYWCRDNAARKIYAERQAQARADAETATQKH